MTDPNPSKMSRLEAVSELDPLFERSRDTPVFVFKHSLICPISRAAYGEYQRFVDQRLAGRDADGAEFALIEIQNARDVSSALASRTGVRHESPQAILLRDGEVAWHASHGRIRENALAAALDGESG